MFTVGIDIGGTFTDLIALDPKTGSLAVEKVPSTPADPSLGLMNGLEHINVSPAEVATVFHGTTVATNAVLERDGAPCGLLTTHGMEDVLAIGWRDRPNIWGLEGSYDPLIPGRQCLGVDERTAVDGEVLRTVDPEEVKVQGERLLEEGAAAVIVSFLHSYANPSNEEAAAAALRDVWPNEHVIRSSSVLPEFREFERTSTATLEAYTRPIVGTYLSKLDERFTEWGFDETFWIMQSNGGAMPAAVTQNRTAHTMLSGPAAGAQAASHLAGSTENEHIISCDMGGTSFDVAVLPEGQPVMTQNTDLDYQLPLRIPVIDITTIGAGGGSIARLDESDIIHVGPESAGADPGPVCYGKGGQDVTLTDANLVLRRINPNNPISEDIDLDTEATENAVRSNFADPLDISLTEAATAIVDIAITTMAGKLREVSIEKGHDPEKFTLVMFGGAGPLHAGKLLRRSPIKRAIVPYYPGILSALGCLVADSRHDELQSVKEPLPELDVAAFHETLAALEADVMALISEAETDFRDVTVRYRANMKYQGQTHAVTVPFESATPTRAELEAAFDRAYLEKYTERVDHTIVIDNVMVTAIGTTPDVDISQLVGSQNERLGDAMKGRRDVCFDGEWHDCPIYRREDIPTSAEFAGPAILEQDDTTTVVDPGLTCEIDEFGNALLTDSTAGVEE